MKKKLFLAGASMLLAAAAVTGYTAYSKASVSDLLTANIEALAQSESTPSGFMKYVCEYVGCCGGDKKCFTGAISYGGASISGTFYMQ